MFSTSLTEDVRLIADDIDAVTDKIDDPVLCQKVEHFANAPFEIQEIYRKDAGWSARRLQTVFADGDQRLRGSIYS